MVRSDEPFEYCSCSYCPALLYLSVFVGVRVFVRYLLHVYYRCVSDNKIQKLKYYSIYNKYKMHYLEPMERTEAISISRRVRERRRKGRPRKESGIYYNHQAVISEAAYVMLSRCKWQSSEPLGSVLDRIINEWHRFKQQAYIDNE